MSRVLTARRRGLGDRAYTLCDYIISQPERLPYVDELVLDQKESSEVSVYTDMLVTSLPTANAYIVFDGRYNLTMFSQLESGLWGFWGGSNSITTNTKPITQINTRFTSSRRKNKRYINEDNIYTFNYRSWTSEYRIGIAPLTEIITKYYSVKVYDGETLTRDLHPCYTHDGKVGFYCFVTNTVYTYSNTLQQWVSWGND